MDAIAKEIRKNLLLNACVMLGEDEGTQLGELKANHGYESHLSGAVRLRFRRAFGNRTLMHAEAIFDKAQAVNNCSGFSLKAEEKETAIRQTALTIRYSVWTWTGWV